MLIRSHSSRRPRLLLAGLALSLVVSACVSSVPPLAQVDPVSVPAVTTMPAVPPEPVTDQTVTAIETYWQARDAAFASGPEAGLAFVVANNHPLLNYTVDQCRDAWFDGEVPVGFAERSALLSGSVESDPTWTMVSGPLAGRDLGNGIFRMVSAFSYEGTQLRVADRVAYVHLQVQGDDVRHFLLCEDADVIVVTPTASAASAAPAPAPAPAPATGGGTAAPTTPTPTQTDPTTLQPITATPSPGGGGSGGGSGGEGAGGTPTATATPNPPGTRPPGTGIDFCDSGDPGAQPVAGDYFLCPDDDVSNETGQDGGTSEPTPSASPT